MPSALNKMRSNPNMKDYRPDDYPNPTPFSLGGGYDEGAFGCNPMGEPSDCIL